MNIPIEFKFLNVYLTTPLLLFLNLKPFSKIENSHQIKLLLTAINLVIVLRFRPLYLRILLTIFINFHSSINFLTYL